MTLAGLAPRTVQTMEIAEGPAGTRQTLDVIAQLARAGKDSPIVRSFALNLWGPTSIERWIRRNWQIVPDPPMIEYIVTPERQLQELGVNGVLKGDCDDAAALVSAMLLSIGFPARLIAVRVQGDSEYSHVWVESEGVHIDPVVNPKDVPVLGEWMEVNV